MERITQHLLSKSVPKFGFFQELGTYRVWAKNSLHNMPTWNIVKTHGLRWTSQGMSQQRQLSQLLCRTL